MKKFYLVAVILSCTFSCSQEKESDLPESNENSENENSEILYSGTLPVLHIDTKGNAPIVSKEEYLNATYYLDALELDGYESIGNRENPLPLKIRGRGNSSWSNYDKKPYRLKLNSKAALCGLKENKNFVLIPHVGSVFLREYAGFELGRMIGLPWTPNMTPLEIVLNREYIGRYFLVENIRVDENRVNIFEQPDETTDPAIIPGGWLVELDNYNDPAQIKLQEENGLTLRITYHTPEILSAQQETFLRNEITAMSRAIYEPDKNSTEWENYIDMDILARYYIVQECIDNADAFHGSTYLYKDAGDNQKWIFGPLWDLSFCFYRTKNDFIYNNGYWEKYNWIAEIAKFPRFQEKVREIWSDFYSTQYPQIFERLESFAALCAGADEATRNRWEQYDKRPTDEMLREAKRYLTAQTDWLNEQWSKPFSN